MKVLFNLINLFLTFTLISSLNISLEEPQVNQIPVPSYEVTYRKLIRPGISIISSDVAVTEGSTQSDCLKLGAQFIAAEAVSQGIFPTSINRVHALDIKRTNYTSSSEFMPAWYYFQIWIAHPKTGILGATFNCSSIYSEDGLVGFSIEFYEIFLDVTAEEDALTLELVFLGDTYQYNPVEGDPRLAVELVEELNELPELGESFWYDPILDNVNHWSLIEDFEERAKESRMEYLLRLGGNFVLQSAAGFLKTDFSGDFYVDKVYNAYEKREVEGWKNYKFDMELVGYYNNYYNVYRVNCQLKHSQKADMVELYSWAIQSYNTTYYI